MKHKCPKCGYEWDSRVRKPKQCPYCKNYLPLLEYDQQLERTKKKQLYLKGKQIYKYNQEEEKDAS